MEARTGIPLGHGVIQCELGVGVGAVDHHAPVPVSKPRQMQQPARRPQNGIYSEFHRIPTQKKKQNN